MGARNLCGTFFFFFDLLYPFFLDDAEGMRWGSPFFVMLAAGWESRRI